jgi:hypothetical protein
MSHVRWNFFTSHGSVLLIIARRPDVTVRDLEAEGYVSRERIGRRNRYTVDRRRRMQEPSAGREIGALIAALTA